MNNITEEMWLSYFGEDVPFPENSTRLEIISTNIIAMRYNLAKDILFNPESSCKDILLTAIMEQMAYFPTLEESGMLNPTMLSYVMTGDFMYTITANGNKLQNVLLSPMAKIIMDGNKGCKFKSSELYRVCHISRY
jgi:hypothetical protein